MFLFFTIWCFIIATVVDTQLVNPLTVPYELESNERMIKISPPQGAALKPIFDKQGDFLNKGLREEEKLENISDENEHLDHLLDSGSKVFEEEVLAEFVTLESQQVWSKRSKLKTVWPNAVLDRGSISGKARTKLGNRKRLSNRDGTSDYHKALHVYTELLARSPRSSAWRTYFHSLKANLHFYLQEMCECQDLFLLIASEDYENIEEAALEMSKHDLKIWAIASVSCDTDLSALLWMISLERGLLDERSPLECAQCWSIWSGLLRRTGRADEADELFATLKTTSPWRHRHQMPGTINPRLLSVDPQPWLQTPSSLTISPEPGLYPPCDIFRVHQDIIRDEFENYQKAVSAGKQIELFHGNHSDASLNVGQPDAWQYMYLRDQFGTWRDELCENYFPQTCDFFRDLESLRVLTEEEEKVTCQSEWCTRGQHPGVVTFYQLAPDSLVRLHNGPTNQRLKCHLVISGPPKGEHGAYLEVAGERHEYEVGDVYGFDDSYYHSAYNGGGDTNDIYRVVLDVSFWHPDLLNPLQSTHDEL